MNQGRSGRVSNKNIYLEGETSPRFTQAFTWTQLGRPESLTYPSCAGCEAGAPLRHVGHAYQRGFLTAIPGILPSVTYHPNQMLHQVQHSNGQTDVWTRDPHDLARPREIALASGAWTTGDYAYDGVGNVSSIGSDLYTYDLVSRVTSASLQGGAAKPYAYDERGNLTRSGPWTIVPQADNGPRSITHPGCDDDGCTAVFRYTVFGALEKLGTTNEHQAWEWDTVGMMKRTYHSSWLAQAPSFQEHYLYTADDERLAVLVRDVCGDEQPDPPECSPRPHVNRWSVRGLDHKVLRTFEEDLTTGRWSLTRDYVWRQGVLAAYFGPTPTDDRHVHVDHLGTPRRLTGGGGVAEYHDYYPYGEELVPLPGDVHRFTGHQRDFGALQVPYWPDDPPPSPGPLVEDLDYMHARYYTPWAATFLSPDPADSTDPARPQSWNKYAYALGSPLKYVDPDGRIPLAGAFVGGGIDLGVQLLIERKSLGEVDYGSVMFSAVAGATGVGLATKLGKAPLLFRATVNLVVDASASVGAQLLDTGEVTLERTTIDTMTGLAAGVATDTIIEQSSRHAGRQLDRALDRQRRIAEDRLSRARLSRAEAARREAARLESDFYQEQALKGVGPATAASSVGSTVLLDVSTKDEE